MSFEEADWHFDLHFGHKGSQPLDCSVWIVHDKECDEIISIPVQICIEHGTQSRLANMQASIKVLFPILLQKAVAHS